MDDLWTICKDLIVKTDVNDPAAEVSETSSYNNEKSNVDVNKLILRIDGLENENKELTNKLNELIECIKIIGSRIKNIDGRPNINEILHKLKNTRYLSMMNVYYYSNPSETSVHLHIYNEHKLIKELQNIPLIEENIQYMKNNKTIIYMLDKYKFIQHYMNLISLHKHINRNHVYGCNNKKEFDEYNTIQGKTLDKHIGGGLKHYHITDELNTCIFDLKAFNITDSQYDLTAYPKDGKMEYNHNTKQYYLFQHYSPEMKKKVKRYNKDLEYCRNNFKNFIKSINDLFKLKEQIKID